MNGLSRKFKIILIICLFIIGAFFVFCYVSAQDTFGLQPVEQNIGLAATDIRIIIAKIIRIILGLLGIIALAIVIYGGFIYMTAGGNEEKVNQAKKILINGIIGLIIILSAFAIVQFVISKLAGATGIVESIPDACQDLNYANTHPEECAGDEWNFTCKENPVFCCANNPKFFIVKSITPVTADAKANNIDVRAIFNQAVDSTQDMGKALTILRGAEDVSGKFGFAWINDEFGKAVGVEARYKSGQETCSDGTYCLPAGNYKTEINPGLKSENGKTITENTDCGKFPLKSSFTIFNNSQFELGFDGKDDYVNVENKGALEKTIFLNSFGTGGITVEAWIQMLGEPNKDFPAVIEKSTGDFSDKPSAQKGFYLSAAYFSNPARDIKWGVGTGSGYDAVEYSISNADLMGKWHHIAGVAEAQSAPGSKLKLYVDGKLVGETNRTYKGSIDAAVDLNIGRWREFGRYFNGLIDEARLYNRALSPIEVGEHYNNGKIKKGLAGESSLVAGWHFDEGSGAQALDYTGNNNHGVIKGGAYWTEGKEEKIKDTTPPQADALNIGGSATTNQPLLAGKIYNISSSITDNSGVGYVKMLVEKDLGNGNKEKVFSYVDGPTVARGSDAPAANPYIFKYPWLIPKNAKSFEKYLVTLEVWDIDYNKTTVSSNFIIKGAQCNNGIKDGDETDIDEGGSCGKPPGEKCTEDWQCASQKCVDSQCVAFPIITNVDTWDGAPGNWITILGKYFGTSPGKIEFGYDNNWTRADLAQCQPGDVWNNNWVIAEVPSVMGMGGAKYAAKFDGITSAINIPHDNSFNFTNNFTIEGWVKWNAPPPSDALGWPGIVSKGDGAVNNYYFGTFDHSREIYFTYLNSGWQDVQSGFSIKDKDWSYIAVTVSGSNINFFVDGNTATKPKPPYLLNVNDNDLLIGFSGNIPEQRFNGWISDVAIYNKALSFEDLNKHYTTGRAFSDYANMVLASQPVSYWRLDEGNGTTAKNVVSGKPDGEYKPGVTFDKEQGGNQAFSGSAVIRLTTAKGDSVTTKDKKQVDKYFNINDVKRPGLCSVKTLDNAKAGPSKTAIQAIGKSFGATQGNSTLNFGNSKAGVQNWSDNLISAFVPNMVPGLVGVYVKVGNEKSNGVKFEVLKEGEESGPVISAIDPSPATPKSYVTISGKGFGDDNGQVWICIGKSLNNDCKELDADLPEDCGDTWSDEWVIAEVPEGTAPANYYLILKNNLGLSTKGENDRLEIKSGVPMPSICKLSPASGPAPRPSGSPLKIYGRNFGDSPVLYFWTKDSELADADLGSWLSEKATITGRHLETFIPVSNEGYSMLTGPIKVKAGGQYSNGIKYAVDDCRNIKPVPEGFHCCAKGPDTGVLKAGKAACQGEVREAGYAWRFATGIIPKLPYVVESCDGITFPSPTPWIKWPQGNEACLNLSIAVRFSMGMDDSALNYSNVKVYKCSDNKGQIDCTGKTEVKNLNLVYGSEVLKISLPSANLDTNTWYHVELSDAIISLETKQELGVEKVLKQPLKKSRPCGAGTAYCFDFKTGTGTCTLTGAGIIPPFYTTNLLGMVQDPRYAFDFENPFNPHFPSRPYYYYVWGKGSQECSVLDADGLGWKWTSSDTDKATVAISSSSNPKYTDSRAVVAAKANAPEGVKITAVTTTLEAVITANSNLIIDLSDPKVIEFWPNCGEACINAEIGARFNQMMVTTTYDGGIKLYKCFDEFCNNKSLVSGVLTVNPELSNINTLRAYVNSSYLESNTWYLVELTSNIKAIGAFDEKGLIREGKSLGLFQWKFRTKADNTPCQVSLVQIIPNPFTAYFVGEKTKYMSFPHGSPDSCSPYGQTLNPWNFGWEWSTGNAQIADVTEFSTAEKLNPYCNLLCLPAGSDIKKGKQISICGNGIVEAGEDCDADLGASCNYNCLRPGNNDKTTCGDKIIDSTKGEECDPPGEYCNPNCTNKGSSAKESGGDINKSWCGSGSITAGEECEGEAGCSSNCLHIGTALSQDWCDKLETKNKPLECNKAVSICGNNVVESGEECEVTGLKTIKVHQKAEEITTTAPADQICDDKCLLQDICDETNIPTTLRCNKDEKYCKDDCTLWGSSPNFSEPSLCGDGKIGMGEYGFCEISLSADILGENPVQAVIAIGLGQENPQTKRQETIVNAKAVAFRNKAGKPEQLTNNQKTGQGNYYLQCGNTESDGLKDGKYNDCVLPGGAKTNQFGVGANSCCYQRIERKEEYPQDGAGFGNSAGICRNAYIEIKLNGEIDSQSLDKNIILISGHEAGYNCASSTQADQSKLINALLAKADASPAGFWQKLWQTVKRFFAGLFRHEASATVFNKQASSVVWCGNENDVRAEMHYTANTSTISIYINNLLEPNREYAVVLKSGQKGLKDARGVGIRNRDSNDKLDDVWLFKTGNQICKLQSITVEPDHNWFKKSGQQKDFQALTHSANGQKIVTTTAYSWNWHWAPADNPVFAIPSTDKQEDAVNDWVAIKSRNIEGTIKAVAQAKVNKDADNQNNQLGKVFTGTSDLLAKFCENPWPQPQGDDWAPYADNFYNFSFSYCADAGKSGNIADDLPFLNDEIISTIKTEESLTKLLFFNNKNDDVFGLQIFTNLKRLSAADWFKDQFPNAPAPQPITIAGFDAVQNGDNYYINGLNWKSDEDKLYNNIYLFSLNKGAQADTKKMLEKILQSLQFNINITDHGYCLNDNATVSDNPDNINDQIPCKTDFECRDANGSAKSGTSGACSNAKTKFFRDLKRLSDMQKAQSQLTAYYDKNANYPDLKSGTYIPGYTVSKWSSWGKLGSAIGGLPLEPVNYWVGCGANILPAGIISWWKANGDANDAAGSHPGELKNGVDFEQGKIGQAFKFDGTNDYVTIADATNPTAYTISLWVKPDKTDNANIFVRTTGDPTSSWSHQLRIKGGKFEHYLLWGQAGGKQPSSVTVSGSTTVVANQWYHIVGVAEQNGQMRLYVNGQQEGGDQTFSHQFWAGGTKYLIGSSSGDGMAHFSGLIDEITLYNRVLSSAEIQSLYNYGKFAENNPNDIDQQTCWNAKQSVYICSQFANVYEYEYVSSTKKYKLHAPLEFFNENSNIVADKVDTSLFTANRWCAPSQVFSPFGEKCGDNIVQTSKGENCDPPGTTQLVQTNCPANNQATATCDSNCTWTYGQCEKIGVCGNGIVEGGEYCDDGAALNGTYGHCAGPDSPGVEQCKGQHPDYCGNKKIDAKNGKNLELCDWSVTGWGLYNVEKIKSCSWDCQNYGNYCGDGVLQSAEGEECDDSNIANQDGCSAQCKKENIACRDQLPYFTTSTSQTSIYISKGNNSDNCTDVNGAVIQQCAENTNGNEICRAYGLVCNKVEGYGASGGASKCIELVSGQSPSCEQNLTWIKDNANLYRVVCDGVYSKIVYSCGNKVKEGNEECDDGNKISGDGCSPSCMIEKQGCGNGVVETYKDNDGKEIVELCDMGENYNGVQCTPSYSKSCVWCSADCKKKYTVDAAGFCGNGKIDIVSSTMPLLPPLLEACDASDNEVVTGTWKLVSVVPPSSAIVENKPKCSDKGKYECLNNCTELKNNCVTCGVKSSAEGGVPPKIALLNPLIGAGQLWPYAIITDPEYLGLFRANKTGDQITSITYLNLFKQIMNNAGGDVGPPTGQHYFYASSTQKVAEIKTGIESNSLCKDEYVLFFNHDQLNTALKKSFSDTELWQKGYGDIFNYPVSGESNVVENELVMSPAVREGIFRVVVRWTDKEDAKNAMFGGLLYSDDFYTDSNKEKSDFIVSYAQAASGKSVHLCREMELKNQYWQPLGTCYKYYDSVFVHDSLGLKKTFIQSFTVNPDSAKTKSIAFFVQNLNGFVASFKNSNLQVEVYEYHPGQVPQYSVYGPRTTFNISKAAGTSSNTKAKYWHVFNLVKEGGKYVVKPVETIETDFCQVLENMPADTVKCKQ